MDFFKETDIVVIGGGITGTAILRELSRYDRKALLIEAEPDLASGTTKANSAIIHAGFDAPVGSLKALTNVRGNALYHELEKELGLDIKWTGSLVVAVTDEEMDTVRELCKRGQENGVPGLRVLDGAETLALEPNLSKEVKGALLAPSAGICWPFGAALAFARCAVQNGAEVLRECACEKVLTENGRVVGVATSKGNIKADIVIDAAGVYADDVAATCGEKSFTIKPRRGEYILFDKAAQASLVKGIVFPVPTKVSKGCLVCATTHGNVFIGPNAVEGVAKDDTSVTQDGLNEIIASARKLLPNLPMGASITEFAGLRAVSSTGDFILQQSAVAKGFYLAAGMQSPGLSAAPAVAEYLVGLIGKDYELKEKKEFRRTLPCRKAFAAMSVEEQREAVAANPLYGRVICRCETVTEGEIVDVIHESCGATTVDGVKRRTRAGMGRCQGGFCGPRVTQILARELGIPVTAVRKEGAASQMFYDKNKGGEVER